MKRLTGFVFPTPGQPVPTAEGLQRKQQAAVGGSEGSDTAFGGGHRGQQGMLLSPRRPLHCSVHHTDWSVAKGGHPFSMTINKQSMHYNSNKENN